MLCCHGEAIPLSNRNLLIQQSFQEPDQMKNISPKKFIYYCFIARIPIISGLILVTFPWIAQNRFPQFLKNLFAMESGIQLILVMLFSTIASITIVSLIKTIIVLREDQAVLRKDQQNEKKNIIRLVNDNECFRYLRTILTLTLFSPIWFAVVIDTQIPDKEFYSTIGMLLSLVILLIVLIYEYQKVIQDSNNRIVKSILQPIINIIAKNKNSNQNLTKRRRRWNAIQIIFGLTLYILVIIFNFPNSFIANILPDNLVAPTLVYVILLIWIFTLILGYATYKFDKYYEKNINSKNFKYKLRFPTILALIVFSAVVYRLANVDHYFKLENSRLSFTELSNYEENFKVALGNRLCPKEFKTDNKCTTEQSLVVMAASGGGIQASGWTAEVLSGLQDEIGPDFTQSIGLISSVSGGSVGTMFYLDNLKNGVVSDSRKLLNNATADWLDSVGWGLAYPDLVRAIGLPFLNFSKYWDRGYSLEKDWEHTLSKPDQTIDDWYEQAKQGEIPIPVFNSTLVENGRRFLISSFKFLPGQMSNYLIHEDLNQNKNKTVQEARALDFRTLYNNCGESANELCSLSVATAARLSATFPYVSPMARNDIDNVIAEGNKKYSQDYHMADGGYFDNAGAYTAIEWLNNILQNYADSLNIKKVVLLQINAFPIPKLESDQKGLPGYKTVSIAPLIALNGVRDSTQRARNIQEARLLEAKWKNQVDIEMFALSFPEKDQNEEKYNPPLSWRLTPSEKGNLDDAWNNDPTIQETLKSIKVFWRKKNESTVVEQS